MRRDHSGWRHIHKIHLLGGGSVAKIEDYYLNSNRVQLLIMRIEIIILDYRYLRHSVYEFYDINQKSQEFRRLML